MYVKGGAGTNLHLMFVGRRMNDKLIHAAANSSGEELYIRKFRAFEEV